MVKFICSVVVLLAMASAASAGWQERWVEETGCVRTFTPGVFTQCEQGAWHQQPGTWTYEYRRYWVKRLYWEPIFPPIIHYEIYPNYDLYKGRIIFP